MAKKNNSILRKLITPDIPRDHPDYMSEYMKIKRRIDKMNKEQTFTLKQLEHEADKLAEKIFKVLEL